MKYIDPKCRLCRREGVKLFLKGDRCLSPKCPIDKRGVVPPGVHGPKRYSKRLSEYGIRLREKQKLKRLYGMTEKQFKKYVTRAKKSKEKTGEKLFSLLESRLDNVVYRLGFAPSRAVARQLVAHGHIFIDNKKVDVASFLVKVDQVVALRPKSSKIQVVKTMLEREDDQLPEWLEKKGPVGRMRRMPAREEVGKDINERLIIEYYSR